MKRAAIYARVSTTAQADNGTSLASQVQLCTDHANEHDYTVVGVWQEDMSGARLDRPKLGEIRDMAQRREIDAVIVFDPDRLSRSMAHTMILLQEFEDNKAAVLFVNAPREDTSEGEMLFGMRSLFAQYERQKILERTRRGRERRVREGQVMMTTRALYGYEYIVAEKRFAVLDSEARWVRSMFEWIVYEGCSLREVARRLEENGVPTKAGCKVWQPSTISDMLKNEAYAGTWYYGKCSAVAPRNPGPGQARRSKSSREPRPRSEWIPVSVPSLVSQELFDAMQSRLKHNQAASKRNSKHPYLFRGILKCSRCGYRMFGRQKSFGGKDYFYYVCPGRTLSHVYNTMERRCDQPTIPAGRIEEDVWDEIVRELSDREALRKRFRERGAELQTRRKAVEMELEALATLELGLKRETGKLLDLHMGDVIDRATLQERMEIIREKQAALTQSKTEVNARLAQMEESDVTDEELDELCEIDLPASTYEERRRFLEGMDAQFTIDGGKVTLIGLLTKAITVHLKGTPDAQDSPNTHEPVQLCRERGDPSLR